MADEETVRQRRKTVQRFEYFELKLRGGLGFLPATKNLGDSEDESDSETGQQSAPHIQLEMLRQSQQCKGTAEFLSRI